MKNKTEKKNKLNKLIEAFHAMEAAGDLPLFDNAHEELEVRGPIPQLNAADMDTVRVVNVAVTLNNCAATLKFAQDAIVRAFSNDVETLKDVAPIINRMIADLAKAQTVAMKTVTKRVKRYARAQAKRKPTPQAYDKTYSKTKIVA